MDTRPSQIVSEIVQAPNTNTNHNQMMDIDLKEIGIVDEIIDSILTPGVNMRVFRLIQYVFGLLQITLLFLLYLSDFSIHVLLLNTSSALLWITLTWYAMVIRFVNESTSLSTSAKREKPVILDADCVKKEE